MGLACERPSKDLLSTAWDLGTRPLELSRPTHLDLDLDEPLVDLSRPADLGEPLVDLLQPADLGEPLFDLSWPTFFGILIGGVGKTGIIGLASYQ